MIRRRAVVALIALLGLTLLVLLAMRLADATLDAAARRDIVAALGDALRDRYVFPETGERAAAVIAKASAAGAYDGLTDRRAFAGRLSADVRAIARDKHLDIVSSGSWLPPRGGPPPGGPPPGPPRELTRIEKLSGGIAYIEVTSFPPLEEFKPVLDRAMSALKGSRALVIDLRRNGGGSPDSVAYFVSYVVQPGRPLSAIISRTPKTRDFTRETFKSVPTPVSFAGVPVYVLTSRNTFSGGEDFAYTVQSLKRATIIGEVTGGGANPAGPVDLGHGLVAIIPFGRSENPVTKTNWEGRGVQPNVAVPAGDALSHVLQRLAHEPGV